MRRFEIHLNASQPQRLEYLFEGDKLPFSYSLDDDGVFTWGRNNDSTIETAKTILLIAARQIEKGLTMEEAIIRFVNPKVYQFAHLCLCKLNRKQSYKLMFDPFLWHHQNMGYCSIILPSGI